MKQDRHIEYTEDERTPSEVLGDVRKYVLRAKRMILNWTNGRSARNALRRARREVQVLPSAVSDEYGLSPQEIEEFIGQTVNDVSDTLADHISILGERLIEQESTGTLTINRSFLVEIEETLNTVELLVDIMEGIERGEVRVR